MTSSPPGEAHFGRTRTRCYIAPTAAGGLADEPASEIWRRLDPLLQPARRPAAGNPPPTPRGVVTGRLGPHAINDTGARHCLERLALSQELEETGPVRPACFGPRIPGEPLTKGFTLPRDTPKYNGTVKPEDWLTDYTTAIGFAGGNHRLVVRYAPLMLQGSARTWLDSLPAGSINTWVDFEQAFVRNFTGAYKRPGRPSQLTMYVQGPAETGREYLARWTELRNLCAQLHRRLQATRHHRW